MKIDSHCRRRHLLRVQGRAIKYSIHQRARARAECDGKVGLGRISVINRRFSIGSSSYTTTAANQLASLKPLRPVLRSGVLLLRRKDYLQGRSMDPKIVVLPTMIPSATSSASASGNVTENRRSLDARTGFSSSRRSRSLAALAREKSPRGAEPGLRSN